MVEQGYGRIVMTTSAGMFGLPSNLSYATAKGGVIGLTRSLDDRGRRARHQGQPHRARGDARAWPAGRPTSRRTTADGAGARRTDGRVPRARGLPGQRRDLRGRRAVASRASSSPSTEGYVHAGPEPTIEDVAEHWATINDETGYSVPADLTDWSATFMAHLRLGVVEVLLDECERLLVAAAHTERALQPR